MACIKILPAEAQKRGLSFNALRRQYRALVAHARFHLAEAGIEPAGQILLGMSDGGQAESRDECDAEEMPMPETAHNGTPSKNESAQVRNVTLAVYPSAMQKAPGG
jgi:hypothetical protein